MMKIKTNTHAEIKLTHANISKHKLKITEKGKERKTKAPPPS
jgi:hypothetical protein